MSIEYKTQKTVTTTGALAVDNNDSSVSEVTPATITEHRVGKV